MSGHIECTDFIVQKTLHENVVRKVLLGSFKGSVAVAKLAKGPGDDMQREAYNMLCARHLGLEAPEVYYYNNRCLIMKFIPHEREFRREPGDYRLAIQYLARLHSISPEKVSCVGLPSHYCGSSLMQRLEDERSYLSKAKDKLPTELYERISATFQAVIEEAAETFSSRCVVGHGDFRPDNLIVSNGKVVPVDWVDFGYTIREYELGALFFGDKNLSLVKQLIEEYLALTYMTRRTGDEEKILRASLSIAYVIMTGSHFRLIQLGEPVELHLDAIKENTEYMESVLASGS